MFGCRSGWVVASMLCASGTAWAGGPPWNAPSQPPWVWERDRYHGYSEPPHVVQQTITPAHTPEAPETYSIVITPQKDPHTNPDKDTVIIMAHVPENARVYIGGDLTQQTGTMREFISPALVPKKDYFYTIRVDWFEDKKLVTQTKKIEVHAGEIHCVDVVKKGSPTEHAVNVAAGLAWLTPDDHKLAVKQKYCALHTDTVLGSTGPVAKVMIKGQPVFLSCEECVKPAEANPDKTLASVRKLLDKK